MPKPFNEIVREARIAHGMTLQAVADAIGKTPAYVSDIEHAKRVPLKHDTITALAKLFGASARYWRGYAILSKMSDDDVRVLHDILTREYA